MWFPTAQRTSPSMQMVKHGKERDCQHLLTIAFFSNRVLGVCLFVYNLIFKSWKRIHPMKKKMKHKSKTTSTKNLPRRHETYLSKNNDVVLQKVNKEENQWHYIIEIQDKYRLWIPLNMNTVQKREEKAGNIFYSQQSPSFHNKTCTHLGDLQNLQPCSPHLFQLMRATAAICNFMMW